MPTLRRVVLTRQPSDNAALREVLADIEAELIDYPCLEVEPLSPRPEVLERLRRGDYGCAIFPSRSSVAGLLGQEPLEPPPSVIAIGDGTAMALAECGWRVTAMPSAATAEVLAAEIDGLDPSEGRVLYARGEIGSTRVPLLLRERGRVVDEAVVYRTLDPISTPLPEDPRPTLLVFASPSSVRHFLAHNARPDAVALCIGPTTEEAARTAGFETILAEHPDLDALASAIRTWLASAPNRA